MGQFLSGKKTHILAALSVIIVTLGALEIINESTRNTLLALILPGGLATLRMGIARTQEEVQAVKRDVAVVEGAVVATQQRVETVSDKIPAQTMHTAGPIVRLQ